MNKYQVSAIIGYWRCGASFETIGLIMDRTASYIEIIVKNYLEEKKNPH